jgi:hypothetical protein
MKINNDFEDKKAQASLTVAGITIADVLQREGLKHLNPIEAQQLVDTIKSFCRLACSCGVNSSTTKILSLYPKEINKKAA